MDITKYDESIQTAHARYLEYVNRTDKRAKRELNRMLKAAFLLQDDALTGYLYSTMASTEYFILGNFRAFVKNLRLATKYLLRSEEEEGFKSIYYLISLEATNMGMHDIAYNYAIAAHDVAKRLGLELEAAIMEETAGYVLLNMGAFEESIEATGRAMPVILRHDASEHYQSNVMAGYFNEGSAHLALGHLKEASSFLKKSGAFIRANEGFIRVDMLFTYYRLGAHIAFAKGDYDETRNCLSKMDESIDETPQITDDMVDIGRFCAAMLDAGAYDLAGELLRILSKKSIQEDAINARRILTNLKADYYTAIGNKRRLAEVYLEQDAIADRIRAEQKKTNEYVRELINLAEEVKADAFEAREEHEKLIVRANTDSLTGIPNRHAMNRRMETAFETAFAKGTRLGIAVIDVDDLKIYNDTYGHAAGDEVLRRIGETLLTLNADERIFAARYGGDEFLLLFEDMTDEEISERILSVQRIFRHHISCGVCNTVPMEKNRIWDFLSSADKALYTLKNGRDKRARGEAGTQDAQDFICFTELKGEG